MHGVDGNRPVNFDRNSLLEFETGCGGAGNRIGGGKTHDFFGGATRQASPYDDVPGNRPILSSYAAKPDDGNGIDPELRDVLRKLINWLSEARKTDNAEGASTVAPKNVPTSKFDPGSSSTQRVETQTEKTDLPKQSEYCRRRTDRHRRRRLRRQGRDLHGLVTSWRRRPGGGAVTHLHSQERRDTQERQYW